MTESETNPVAFEPELVGLPWRVRFLGGTLDQTACGPQTDHPVIPSTTFVSGPWPGNLATNLWTAQITASNDCIDTIASYPPVQSPCWNDPPPGDDVDSGGANAPVYTGGFTTG